MEANNEWIRFGTEKIPNEGQIEILFDDGSIHNIDDDNLPFAEVTHWRYKNG